MDKSIRQDEGVDKAPLIYNDILNDVIRKKARELVPEGEQNWYAEYVFHLPAANYSAYLNGTRSFPAWLVVAHDKAFKCRALLDVMNEAETSGPPIHKAIDPRTVEKLFVLALKEEGVFNSMLAQEIADHFVDPAGIEHLDRELNKMSHFLIAMRERLQDARERTRKPA